VRRAANENAVQATKESGHRDSGLVTGSQVAPDLPTRKARSSAQIGQGSPIGPRSGHLDCAAASYHS